MKKIIKIGNKAVSEVLGTILLLVISTTLFSVVYVSVLSIHVDPETPSVNIVGSIENNTLIIDHHGGESLPLDTIVIIGNNGAVKQNEVRDYLNDEDKSNNEWDIGEKASYNLNSLPGFQRFDPIDLTVVDVKSNSVVMMGTVQEDRYADIEVSIYTSNLEPKVGSTIEIIFKAKNNGPSEAKNTTIQLNIPGVLTLDPSSANDGNDDGSYNILTGIWSIDSIASGNTAVLKMNFRVNSIGVMPTQLAMVIDGSDHSDPTRWSAIINALANAVQNMDIPNNNLVELTVIQCGETNLYEHKAKVEIDRVVISNNPTKPSTYYLNIANNIRSISRLGGHTYSLACGLRDAADLLKTSTNPNMDYLATQIINLIVCGEPNQICSYPTDGSSYQSVPTPRISAEEQRNYLIEQLSLGHPGCGYDKIDCEFFESPTAASTITPWLENKIIFPGLIPQPYPNYGKGFLKIVQPGDDFSFILHKYFTGIFKSQTVSIKLISTEYPDNDFSNDYFELMLTPK